MSSSWIYEQYGSLERTVTPTVLPVSMEQAKFAIGIPVDDDSIDADLEDKIREAVDIVERDGRRCLMSQTWRMMLDRFPCSVIELPRVPVASLSHVKYITNGVLTTLSGSVYQTDFVSQPARLCPARNQYWPITDYDTFNAVQITWVAGYATKVIMEAERPSARAAVLAALRHLFLGCELSDNYWTLIYRLRP